MNDIDRLQGIYGAAGRELRRSLWAINPANYSDVRAATASAKAKEIARVLNVAAERWASEAIPRAYAKSARVSKTALEILGRKPRRKTYDDRRRRLIDDLSVILIRANGSIPKIVERYLAEHRYLLRERQECRDALLDLLDAFVDAGWRSAMTLTYRLHEMYR